MCRTIGNDAESTDDVYPSRDSSDLQKHLEDLLARGYVDLSYTFPSLGLRSERQDVDSRLPSKGEIEENLPAEDERPSLMARKGGVGSVRGSVPAALEGAPDEGRRYYLLTPGGRQGAVVKRADTKVRGCGGV